MGKRRGPYKADFPVGTRVRIAGREILESFQRPRYPYHHPIDADQLQFAGQVGTVREASHYHGADELYQLEGIPGYWHEECLTEIE